MYGMGNREDLLTGAKHCLYEKGYARTTARDIAEASGVSLAAIGYHFGSKDALMNEAMFVAFDDWGGQLGDVDLGDLPADGIERFAAMWDRVIAAVTRNRRVVAASFEAFPQSEHAPQLRARLAAGQQEGRRGLVALMHGIDEAAVSETDARTLGSFYLALMSGVLAQWLIAPERTPTGADLAEALRMIAAGVSPAQDRPR
jgi:AcrR family transcriptional regulator